MSMGIYRLLIYQGTEFERVFSFLDDTGAVMVLTDYTAKLTVRATRDAATTLLALTSSPAAGLTVNGVAGTVTMLLTAAQTTALTWTKGVWDLVLTPGAGDPEEPYVGGDVEVVKAVSR